MTRAADQDVDGLLHAPLRQSLWNSAPAIPVGTSYTPSTLYQYNSTGVANTALHQATGTYRVTLPGLGDPQGGRARGLVHVTAYGLPASDKATFCDLESNMSTPANAVFLVECSDSQMSLVDSGFVLQYTESGNPMFAPTTTHPTAWATYACSPLVSFVA